jgi:tetratricopeptide (TPR) repeat protein
MTVGTGLPRWVVPAAVVLGLNSAWLALRHDPTLFYFANVAGHAVLGVALSLVLARWLPSAWASLSPLARAAAALFTLSGLFGFLLMVTGTTRPWRWALFTHIALAAAGSITLGVRLMSLGASLPAPALLRGAVAVAVVGAALTPAFRYYADHLAPNGRPIVNPDLPPLSMEGEGPGPQSPFFPSSSDTNTGEIIPATFFMTSTTCARCHKDIYDQWNSSAHHLSSFNNQWYRKSIEYMQDVVGTKPSKWCAGCHDHAVFFNGRFDRPIKEQIDTPEAQNGLGCTSCHSIVHVRSTMGQGDFEVEYPPLHDLAVSEQPLLAWTHDYLLKLDPVPHKRTFMKAFHREQTADFCSACHKVHLDVPVNDYRWFRGFNDYDAWQASGMSGQGARSFYYPPKPQRCADCHMPMVPSNDPAAIDGKVHSHRFPAANTALPFVNGDHEQLRITQEFLKDGVVSLDIFGIVPGEAEEAGPAETRRAAGGEPRIASTFAVGEEGGNLGAAQAVFTKPAEVIAPLGKVEAVLRRGESTRVEVVLRTRKIGHFFPGGTVDAFDVWVELEAVDSNGKTVFHSGSLVGGDRGPVDPGAHIYRSLLLDERGNPINKRNAWAARSVAYVRLVPPGAADTIHYRLKVPEDCGDEITLKARVNYRKFAWWNTQWAFAGERDPDHKDFGLAKSYDDGRWVFTGDTSKVSGNMKEIPNLPVTVMASSEARIKVLPKGAPRPEVKPFFDKSVRERWNDYGIGLLLQGDLRAAEETFLRVTQMEPEYADGWVNVGRVRLQEGNMAGAEEMFRKALEIDAKLAKTHFFLGSALKALGRYDEALEHTRVAQELYPRDRVVINQTGRLLFLKRQHQEAVAELKNVLGVDPEDVQAHYNLMLAYQGMGNEEMAKKHQALYERFKADEAAQFITGPYRQLHPHDNNERQAIHEHRNAEPAKAAAPEKKTPAGYRAVRSAPAPASTPAPAAGAAAAGSR